MKKINKIKDESFVIREDILGNKHLATSGYTSTDLLKSYFNGRVLYATYRYKVLYTSVSEYCTKEKNVIKGFFKADIYIYNGIKYYEERNTEKIIDVVIRTVIDEYYKSLNCPSKYKAININKEDKKALIILINFYLRKIVDCVKVTELSDIILVNSLVADRPFKKHDEISEKKDIESINVEYYEPAVTYVEDDLASSKISYKNKVHVAKNEVLYYCGLIKKPGDYFGRYAKGVIVSNGKHVFSTSPQVFEDDLDNKCVIYPNVIYNVTDIKNYIYNYLEVKRLLNELTEIIIKNMDKENEIENIISLEDYKKADVSNILSMLKEYSVDVDYIMYSTINPCVRSKNYVKGEINVYTRKHDNNR